MNVVLPLYLDDGALHRNLASCDDCLKRMRGYLYSVNYVLATSGKTAGVMHIHCNCAANAESIVDPWVYKPIIVVYGGARINVGGGTIAKGVKMKEGS